MLGSIIEPARNAVAADLTPAEELLGVNTALGLLAGLARLIGGPLGGLLLGFTGIEGVVLVDAVSFLAAAVLIAARRRPRPRPVAPEGRGVQAIGALVGGLLLGWVAARLDPVRLLAASLVAFGVLSAVVWNGPLVTTALALNVGLFIAVGVPGSPR